MRVRTARIRWQELSPRHCEVIMAGDIYPPFKKPKDGNNYEFLGFARVSDPREGKQDIKSLDAQERSTATSSSVTSATCRSR